jgi:hypothetical protein
VKIPAEKPEKLKIIFFGVSLAQTIFLRRTYAEKDFEKILMRVFFPKTGLFAELMDEWDWRS